MSKPANVLFIILCAISIFLSGVQAGLYLGRQPVKEIPACPPGSLSMAVWDTYYTCTLSDASNYGKLTKKTTHKRVSSN